MTTDPYLYPGTDILRNRLGLRDRATLQSFEIEATMQRLSEGLPNVPLTPAGYLRLHLHIFQDVYDWAGQPRTIDIAKPGALFCRAPFIHQELGKRFERIAAQDGLRGSDQRIFISAMAEHLSELNAIHPFREGNGRVLRAFLQVLADHAGHPVAVDRIDPVQWMTASKESFSTGSTKILCRIIAGCLVTKDH